MLYILAPGLRLLVKTHKELRGRKLDTAKVLTSL